MTLRRGWFFLFALVFHFSVYAIYLYPATIETKSTIEPDDAYAYMHKSAALFHCIPLSSCPAYESLLRQAAHSEAEKWTKDRFTGRIFCNYSMLHSLALRAAQLAFGSWEIAYNALVIAGGIFLVMAFACLTFGLFGLTATSIWLLFFTSVKYRGAGWQYIVPANISAGIAALSWYFLLKKQESRRPVAAALLAGFAILTHPIGLVYAGVGFGILIISSFRDRKHDWFSLALFLSVVAAAKGLLGFFQVSGLECSFGSHVGIDAANFSMGARILGQWLLQQPGSFPYVIFSLVVVFRAMPAEQRWGVTALLGALSTAFLASHFYILPGYPDELAIRLLLPLGLVLSGFLAAGFSHFLVLHARWRNSRKPGLKLLATALAVLLFLDAGRVLFSGLAGPPTSWQSLSFWQNAITRTPDLYWEKAQADFIFSHTDSSSLVAFDHEINLYHALAYGLSGRRVNFLPFKSPESSTERASLYVLASPVQPVLLGSGSLQISYGEKSPHGPLELILENHSYPAALIVISNGKEDQRVEIPGWSELRVVNGKLTRDGPLVVTETGKAKVILKSILAGQSPGLQWPWGLGFELRYGGATYPIELGTNPCGPDCRIVHDGGFGVVVQPR